MRKAVCCWVGVLALVASTAHAGSAGADGPPATTTEGAGWQGLKGRLSLGTSSSFRIEPGSAETDPLKINSLSVMGDYYLSRPWLGTAGGLRATSGLLLGSRASLWSSPASVDRRAAAISAMDAAADNTGTLPYLGVGYTGLSSKGGWGLSADLGLMALNPRSAARLGTHSLDDTVREMRFSPLLQVGLSFSF
jgi:hypothetical protein